MIRMATINDIDSLVNLRIELLNEQGTIDENYDWNNYSQALSKFFYDGLVNGKVSAFLVEKDGTIVSLSIMCFYNIIPLLYNLEGKMALLTDMYTIPKYRNKGFGISLLNSIMGHAKDLGYKKVILNATESGRKLYSKYGFQDINGEMSYKFK
jgi:GNAT superfamily N-acetyltransferase